MFNCGDCNCEDSICYSGIFSAAPVSFSGCHPIIGTFQDELMISTSGSCFTFVSPTQKVCEITRHCRKNQWYFPNPDQDCESVPTITTLSGCNPVVSGYHDCNGFNLSIAQTESSRFQVFLSFNIIGSGYCP